LPSSRNPRTPNPAISASSRNPISINATNSPARFLSQRALPNGRRGDEIPLSTKAAVQAARAELKTLFADGADWTLTEVKLTHCADADHWYYLVNFSAPDKRPLDEKMIGHPLPSFRVPVLLNGVVVTPDITDRVAHK
jgi:hypothetical protein